MYPDLQCRCFCWILALPKARCRTPRPNAKRKMYSARSKEPSLSWQMSYLRPRRQHCIFWIWFFPRLVPSGSALACRVWPRRRRHSCNTRSNAFDHSLHSWLGKSALKLASFTISFAGEEIAEGLRKTHRRHRHTVYKPIREPAVCRCSINPASLVMVHCAEPKTKHRH